VGTFDEAFKSRIQLSLHYENLNKGQRMKIWKNFFRRLETLEEAGETSGGVASGSSPAPESLGIDFSDIYCFIEELAESEMNGRQIRNAITTARQLAQFKGEIMSTRHLKHVIQVSSKFDAYLRKVQDGFSDDQLARGDGIR
jgi:hypothetical protein